MDTKEIIKAQFMEKYAKKEFSRITVKGLCAAAPVARTTFYAYFDNTNEVKAAVEEDLIGGLMEIAERESGGSGEARRSGGLRALRQGRVLCYCGLFTRAANFLSRIFLRAVTRKAARHMNRC